MLFIKHQTEVIYVNSDLGDKAPVSFNKYCCPCVWGCGGVFARFQPVAVG